jgi:hypothetical protein
MSVSRRNVALGVAGGGWLAMAAQETGGGSGGGRFIDVTARGAKGDGKTDDTKAIQAAIDEAGKARGAVFVPPGVYPASELQLRPNMGLYGIAGWDYHQPGGSVIRLADDKAKCLLNITGASGVTINGLSLAGGNLGSGIHGIMLDKPDYGHEDSFRIDGCQVTRFTGDGVFLGRGWAWFVRHSMIAYNRGDGIRLRGWDGFVMDCWLSANRGAGFGARDENAAMTFTGNRIEWNGQGIYVRNGNSYNITGNYFDRNSGYGLALLALNGKGCTQMTVTGNYVRRSGPAAIRLEAAMGVTVVGNTLAAGQDDGGRGKWSPSYGIVYEGLSNCVISSNVLHQGALKQLLADLGGHGEGVVVKDNPGSLRQA